MADVRSKAYGEYAMIWSHTSIRFLAYRVVLRTCKGSSSHFTPVSGIVITTRITIVVPLDNDREWIYFVTHPIHTVSYSAHDYIEKKNKFIFSQHTLTYPIPRFRYDHSII